MKEQEPCKSTAFVIQCAHGKQPYPGFLYMVLEGDSSPYSKSMAEHPMVHASLFFPVSAFANAVLPMATLFLVI